MKRQSLKTGKSRWKKVLSMGLLLMLSLLFAGCSERKTPPPPKHHPELLLEVLEKGAKKDYVQMLPRVKKLRAVDSSSVFLPELESAVSLNILVNEINRRTADGDFVQALALVERYERFHGPGKETAAVKLQLQNLVALDSCLKALSGSHRSSTALSRDIYKLAQLGKKMRFSPKIRNFMDKKRSQLAWMKKTEYRNMLFGLWSDMDFLTKTGVQDGAQALAAVFAVEVAGMDKTFPLSLPGVRIEMLSPDSASAFFPAR